MSTKKKVEVKKADTKKVSVAKKLVNVIKIIRQACHAEIKDNNLILQSIKIFANDKSRIDSVTLKIAELKKILASIKKNDVEQFRAKFYYLCRKDALKIDSESQRLNLCKHARARQHVFNQIARAMKREDLLVEYSKQEQVAK